MEQDHDLHERLEKHDGPSTPDRNQRVRARQLRHTPTHRPLVTADSAASTRSRFHALFTTALSPRLSPRESAKFIDRFRYIICTSQLLADKIVASDAKRSRHMQRPSLSQIADQNQHSWDDRATAKYWMGSGGCVILVSLLIAWALKAPERGLESKSRSIAALTLSLILALYLYAQYKKAHTRMLHRKAAELIQTLVSSCQNFDATVCKTINLVQEVELLSRGYRLDYNLPPIARIEANSRQRRCLRLRTTLVSSLNLVYSATGRASTVLEHLTNSRDYNKLSDVYNIILHDEDDLSALCEDLDGLSYLKTLFHHSYARRRKLLCCLLAVQADGRPGNVPAWRVVVEQLQIMSSLTSNLADQLENTLVDDDHELQPNQIASNALEIDEQISLDSKRSQVRGLDNLSQTLRRTQAKMYILREQSTKILLEPKIDDAAKSDLLAHYDSLEHDIHALMADWRDGREILQQQSNLNPLSPTTEEPVVPDAAQRSPSIDGDAAESRAVLIRPDSLGFWGPRMSIRDFSALDMKSISPLEDALSEEVFEGSTIALPPASRPSATRAERIALMRQEREKKQARSLERLKEQQARESLQGELASVLGQRSRRPLGLRVGIHPARLQAAGQQSAQAPFSPPLANGKRNVSTSSEQSIDTLRSLDSGLGTSIISSSRSLREAIR